VVVGPVGIAPGDREERVGSDQGAHRDDPPVGLDRDSERFLRGLLWIHVKDSSRLRAGDEEPKAPAFITVEGLATFPGASLAVAVVWTACNKLFGVADVDRNLVVLLASGLVGLVLYVWGWGSLTTPGQKFGAFVISIFNSLYLALTVLGIDITLVNRA
jgi:hypothetical protein